ncbi:MAG: MFS transporter [Phycisphaerae bacterium]|nr:MFS transporter [Phycisphaerae bacterium]
MEDTATSSRPAAPARPGPEGSPPARSIWRGVLRHDHFRWVWFAAFGSSLGAWMETVGVQWAMAQATLDPAWHDAGKPGAAIMMGYLAVAQMAPMLLFGLLAGIAVDRFNRKRLLIVTQVLLMAVAAALTLASALHILTPWVLIVLGAANGIVWAFNMPAWQVLTPRLVPREELADAITLNGMQFNLARAVGPALGGLLMARFGPTVMFAVNTLSFLGLILAVARTAPTPAAGSDGTHPWRQILDAARYALGTKGPLLLILASAVFCLLGTPFLRELPIFVKAVYGKEEAVFGLLLGFMGIGAVAAVFLLRLIPPWYPKHHFIPLSLTLAGITITGLCAAQDWIAAAAWITVAGVFWMWGFNSIASALQLLVPDHLRGRVLSVNNIISFGAMGLGPLLAGWIAEGVSGSSESGSGAQIGAGVLALALVAAGVVMLTWREPEVDGLKPGDPGYERRPGLLRGITAAAHRPARTKADPPVSQETIP